VIVGAVGFEDPNLEVAPVQPHNLNNSTEMNARRMVGRVRVIGFWKSPLARASGGPESIVDLILAKELKGRAAQFVGRLLHYIEKTMEMSCSEGRFWSLPARVIF